MLGLAALVSAAVACSSPEQLAAIGQIAPSSPELEPGATTQFQALVGDTPDEADWSVVEPDGGTIDAAGFYTAPITDGTYTVQASFKTVGFTRTTSVRVKKNIRVAVSPTAATMTAGESLTFGATVTGSDNAVTWSVAGGDAAGTITAAGVYTAPATAGTYTVVATSAADPSQSGTATVVVNAATTAPTAVSVSPQGATIVAGTTFQFAAKLTGLSGGVTWSATGGSISASGLYTAPATAGTYTVKATSQADGSKADTATVTVTPVPVDTTPAQPVNTIPAWVMAPMDRVSPTAAQGTTASARLYAGKGEYEAFQVIVRGPTGGLSNVDVKASDLTSSTGKIPAANVTLYREKYVTIGKTSPDLGTGNRPLGSGVYPDGLIPFLTSAGARNTVAAPFTVAAGQNQPIWVDVFVPRGTPAGTYSGRVTVTAAQGTATIPVTLTVWNFELPLKPTLKSSFGIRSPWNADPLYYHLLTDHKVMPRFVAADQSADLVTNHGLNEAQLPFYSHRSGCTMDAAPSVTSLQSSVSQYPSNLDVYVYVVDEPQYGCSDINTIFSQVTTWSKNIHQTRAKVLVTYKPNATLLNDGSGRSVVDIWSPMAKDINPTDTSYQTALSKGTEIWSYTTLETESYSPKWQIDFDPINYRIYPGFISQSMGLTGILYWSSNAWNTSDPWTEPYYYTSACIQAPCSFPGEGILMYPGAAAGMGDTPVPSMRLKYIREGVEDYEYVAMLKRAGRGDFAMQVAKSVGADFHNWTKDHATLENARIQLGEELNRINTP